jgi:hypothetical protein
MPPDGIYDLGDTMISQNGEAIACQAGVRDRLTRWSILLPGRCRMIAFIRLKQVT